MMTQKRIVAKIMKDIKIILDDKFKAPSVPGFMVVCPEKKEMEMVK